MSKSENMKDVLFALGHPRRALRAKVRQVLVAIEHRSPPDGVSFEEFPEMNLRDASRAMITGSRPIQLGDWPESLQGDFRLGKEIKPDGRHPEHPNI